MSKRKGTNYENKIANILDSYLSQYIEEYRNLTESNPLLKIQRDKSSGNDLNSFGDINPNIALKYFPFIIECKHWKKLNLNIKSLYKNSDFDKIIEQVLEKKNSLEKINPQIKNLIPVIIFRGNYTEDYILFLAEGFDKKFKNLDLSFQIKTLTKKNRKILIFLLKEFLSEYFSKEE